MPPFASTHLAFCFTGIHSFAGAVLLRRSLGMPLDVRLSSQHAIMKDLREAHRQWTSAGPRSLQTLAVLGPLVQKDALEDQANNSPGIIDILDDLAKGGVRVEVFNEYEDLICLEGTNVGHHIAPKPNHSERKNPTLAGKVAEVFQFTGGDPLNMAMILGKHELGLFDIKERDSLVLALEWLFVETMQNREDIRPLTQLVEELSTCTRLPEIWEKRAIVQRQRGRGVIIGKSYQEPLRQARKVADSDLPVVILGETGSGKEMMARRIHDASSRWDEPFIDESCANFTETLFESELFGVRRGAFTGANEDRKGLLEKADKGTLFLDEIGELSPTLQGKLLRVLQEKKFRRVGDTETQEVNVRIVAATNVDLYARAREGTFRLDLWYRLAGEVIRLRPLREIPDDLHDIANHLQIQLYNDDSGLLALRRKRHHIPRRLDKTDTTCLRNHDWPGNVRELRLAIHRHLVTGRPLATIVQELLDQETNWKSLSSASAPAALTAPATAFVVQEVQTLRQIHENYLRWVKENHPKLNRTELAEMLKTTTETLRKHLGPSK